MILAIVTIVGSGPHSPRELGKTLEVDTMTLYGRCIAFANASSCCATFSIGVAASCQHHFGAHTHMHILRTHSYTRTHTHIHTHAHTHTHAFYAHTHTLTHIRTYYAHVYTHIHTLVSPAVPASAAAFAAGCQQQ